jgi:3-hydroxyacyl-[acyl-carrier-protein] dehydratase
MGGAGMLLEYFQMIDRVETVDLEGGKLAARSTTPEKSPVFEGHFPGLPLVPGVLLIETMAQASGYLILAKTSFESMPFLVSVDKAKLRTFVEPNTPLSVAATLVHEGSGFAVMKGMIEREGKRIADCELKLRILPADNAVLAAEVKKRALDIGLMDAITVDRAGRTVSGDAT